MTIKKLIVSEIKKKGQINIYNFIDLSLFGNDGYYSKKNPIGKYNDFITAPEISQMFGEIIGSFIISYWEEKIRTEFNLIELGPGKGTLIKDILRVANLKKQFIESMYLNLIEKNQQLVKLQKTCLNKIKIKKPAWKENFEINNNLPSIIYSNEFFDCFPVRQFYKKEKWFEKYIHYNSSDDIFSFTSKEIIDELLLKSLNKFNNFKIAEISNSRKIYFDNMCKFINKNKGVIVTIDYGYKKPPGQFSLQTVFNHKKTHLFENIGNQDITAHVNFDELISVAKGNQLKIDIYCSQKDFLISFGIKERKKKLKMNQSQNTKNNLELEYRRLTNDSQMGKDFKVLVVSCL